jgi:hypothetical protein
MTQSGSLLGWSVVGLIYDIVGATFLVVAIFFNSPVKIAHQAGTYWDSSTFAARALSEQTLDARVGLVLLIAGFVLQILGQLQLPAEPRLSQVLIAAVALFALGYLLLARKWLVARLVSRVEAVQRQQASTGKS